MKNNLRQLFTSRNARLLAISMKRIRQGDYFPRSNKVLHDINKALFENNTTDELMLERFGGRVL